MIAICLNTGLWLGCKTLVFYLLFVLVVAGYYFVVCVLSCLYACYLFVVVHFFWVGVSVYCLD